MKYLDGQEVLKGDAVIAPTEETVVVGQVHQFMERTGHVRITGYALPVKAETCLLAKDAYAALAEKVGKSKQSSEEEAAKAAETPGQGGSQTQT
jgi:hypothetical protein